jgi:hypothetical protein
MKYIWRNASAINTSEEAYVAAMASKMKYSREMCNVGGPASKRVG